MLHHLFGDHSVVSHQTLDGATEHFERYEKRAHQQYGDGQFGV